MSMPVIDATGHVVGRLASVLAKRLLNGEEIVVVNAEKAIVTGRRRVVFEEYRTRHQRGSTASRMRGIVRINSVPVEMYQFELGRLKILEPLKLAGRKVDAIDIDVNVQGGGVMGQADAVRTAIARGLVQYLNDKELETVFREYDRTLIVPDTRRKLPKKPLGRGARKKRQKSYR